MEQVMISKAMVRDEPDKMKRAQLESIRQRQQHQKEKRIADIERKSHTPAPRMEHPPEKWTPRDDSKTGHVGKKYSVDDAVASEAAKAWIGDGETRTMQEIYEEMKT